MPTPPTLDQIQRDIASENGETRERAMQYLAGWAKRDRAISALALPVFQNALEGESEAPPALAAVRGIEAILGAAEGRLALLKLANHPLSPLAGQAVLQMKDASFIPELLELLQRRPEIHVQTAALYVLGQLKATEAFSPMVQRLSIPEMRVSAIEALTALGDARAIPHLEGVLGDQADAWEPDGHVATLRVCDLAMTAIERLRGGPAASATCAPRRFAGAAPSIPPAPATAQPARLRRRFLPYIPLAAAVAAVPWIAGIMFIQVVRAKPAGASGAAAVHTLDALCMIPGAIGLFAAALAMPMWRSMSVVEWICMAMGCLGCGMCIFSFGYEFLH